MKQTTAKCIKFDKISSGIETAFVQKQPYQRYLLQDSLFFSFFTDQPMYFTAIYFFSRSITVFHQAFCYGNAQTITERNVYHNMRVMLYGEISECQQAIDTFHSYLPLTEEAMVSIRIATDREAFQKQIVEWEPNLIIVLADRADGMEGVYTAKETHSDIPVFWFSDDEGFGMQSYRLRCDYFAVKPFTVEKLKKAFHRCMRMGIRINGLPQLP